MSSRWMKIVFCVLVLSALATAQNINAAGATFPYPIYSKWFNEYHQKTGSVQINYQAIGSGGGIKQLQVGTVDFGASDMPMTNEQLASTPFKVVHIPTVLGAVVPAYHIPGVNAELKFTPEILAGIFLGHINNWADPQIAKANPGIKFPNQSIVVVHRSDGSGTTFIFTDYLSKVSGEWKSSVGANTSVKWPVGIGGKGNEGVAGMVRQIDGSIGYVELIYAVQNNIPYGQVRNKAGNFIKASLETTTAAAAGVKIPADYRVSITNPDGKYAYPLASFTWMLIPAVSKDPAKGKIIREFLEWEITEGQKQTSQLTYAPLPKEVANKVAATIKTIK
ncbi:MAG: phosphate ABC transporter substrate-binding protein PstS [Acidobacteriota bacterium]|nr:phosphate ABC transporter substrate-binding protein PstS [Acidobacteriota bacterium]